MKLKMGLMGLAAATGLALFGGAAGAAFADEPPVPVPPSVISPLPPPPPGADGGSDAAPLNWRWDFAFSWMHLGIIDDAAQVIGMPGWEIRDRLREGRSLAEIARNHGVGEDRLENGILRGEWDDLARQVREGHLNWDQAAHYYRELAVNIDEIIHFHG